MERTARRTRSTVGRMDAVVRFGGARRSPSHRPTPNGRRRRSSRALNRHRCATRRTTGFAAMDVACRKEREARRMVAQRCGSISGTPKRSARTSHARMRGTSAPIAV